LNISPATGQQGLQCCRAVSKVRRQYNFCDDHGCSPIELQWGKGACLKHQARDGNRSIRM